MRASIRLFTFLAELRFHHFVLLLAWKTTHRVTIRVTPQPRGLHMLNVMCTEGTEGLSDAYGIGEVKDGHSTTGCGPADQSARRTGLGGFWLVARSPCCHDEGNQVLPVWSVSRRIVDVCWREEKGWIGCRTLHTASVYDRPAPRTQTCTDGTHWGGFNNRLNLKAIIFFHWYWQFTLDVLLFINTLNEKYIRPENGILLGQNQGSSFLWGHATDPLICDSYRHPGYYIMVDLCIFQLFIKRFPISKIHRKLNIGNHMRTCVVLF